MTDNSTDHADVKIHPPILTLLHLIAAFLLYWLLPFPTLMPQIMRILGIVLVFTGLALAFLAVRQFSLAHTTVDPHGSVKVLVTAWPYRLSRNPIYLGFIYTIIGLPLALGTYWGVALSPLLILSLNNFVIRYEEAYLEKKFGMEYTNYKSLVRRWL